MMSWSAAPVVVGTASVSEGDLRASAAGPMPSDRSWATHDAPVKFEYLDHTADVQIHSWGSTLQEAFEQQVLGIMGLITDLSTIRVHAILPSERVALERHAARAVLGEDALAGGEAAESNDVARGTAEGEDVPRGVREVCAEAHDLPSLLYQFLDEWLFQFNAELFVCRRLRIVALDRQRWTVASVGIGETFELGRHPQGTEVKAITFSAMRITEGAERTDVLVIVDI